MLTDKEALPVALAVLLVLGDSVELGHCVGSMVAEPDW